MLIFNLLKSLFLQSSAKLDSNNLKTFEQYNKAEHQQMFANICLSKKIQEIYKKYTPKAEDPSAYRDDIIYFREILASTYKAINRYRYTKTIDSIIDYIHYVLQTALLDSLHIVQNDSFVFNSYVEIDISKSVLKIATRIPNNLNVMRELNKELRKWYIHCKLLQWNGEIYAIMRYIYICFRYFYHTRNKDINPIEVDMSLINRS